MSVSLYSNASKYQSIFSVNGMYSKYCLLIQCLTIVIIEDITCEADEVGKSIPLLWPLSCTIPVVCPPIPPNSCLLWYTRNLPTQENTRLWGAKYALYVATSIHLCLQILCPSFKLFVTNMVLRLWGFWFSSPSCFCISYTRCRCCYCTRNYHARL